MSQWPSVPVRTLSLLPTTETPVATTHASETTSSLSTSEHKTDSLPPAAELKALSVSQVQHTPVVQKQLLPCPSAGSRVLFLAVEALASVALQKLEELLLPLGLKLLQVQDSDASDADSDEEWEEE